MSWSLRVADLWKEYQIGERRRGADTFYDVLGRWIGSPLAALRRHVRAQAQDRFWALREVGFEVEPGEALGIIGRNGAGKSTLLKVLSRITSPTRGRIEVRGRLASLLEVGTGFHPELTGRENIFLNGAILGMTRREIERSFDEIVAFAEVEKFLDTPVKRFSSGMYVRLAFAVAAHLDPDILIVDEVLAVGDAAFQRKCLEKMGQVGGEGRTVLFVSHNMSAISRLCRRSLCLQGGRIVSQGPTDEVVGHYLAGGMGEAGSWSAEANAGRRWLLGARVVGADGQLTAVVRFDEPFEVEIDYVAPAASDGYTVALKVTNARGVDIFSSSDLDSLASRPAREGSKQRERCRIPAGLLRPGQYVLTPMVIKGRFSLERIEEATLHLEVSAVGFPFEETRWGVIAPALEWRVSSPAADDRAPVAEPR